MLSACKVYKQDILFGLEEGENTSVVKAVQEAERNYMIQVDDILRLDVFTNEGERIIDPNFELQRGIGFQNQNMMQFTYLVQLDSMVKIPVIGKMKLAGLTIDEAESALEDRFDDYYKGSFVKLTFQNKRVVVLGAPGGQIVPMTNENMSLLEVLALAGGIDFGARAHNVRIVRGPLENPQVYLVNLNTVEGMKASIIPIEPGDVIYVEPWRRPFFEALRDATPILSATTSLIAFILLIDNLTN